MWTPNDIEVLIHHATRVHKHPREDAQAVSGSIAHFIGCGMMEETPPGPKAPSMPTAASVPWEAPQAPSLPASRYRLTPKGRAWLAMLQSTPMPVEAYVDPRTGEQITT